MSRKIQVFDNFYVVILTILLVIITKRIQVPKRPVTALVDTGVYIASM